MPIVLRRLLLSASCWLLTVSVGFAQTGGTIAGQVADETGGVLPGASVELRPAGIATPLETVTDGVGAYRFDNVPAGQAELTFRLINFSTIRRAVTVTPGGTVTANALMLVAASADIVITAPRTFRNLAEIENPAENLVGVASAGSEGAITAAQLAVRPVNRATEVLETVPGMIISQHSGEGKANQYYLRGFNLDHGFDFAQTVAGIPVNMPTHAHAQGYATRPSGTARATRGTGSLSPSSDSGTTGTRPTRFRSGRSTAASSTGSGSSRKPTAAKLTGTAGSSTGSDPGRIIRPGSPPTCSGTACSSFTTSRTS
jgi:hypothetical protein